MVLIRGYNCKGIPFFPIVPPPTHTLFHCPLFHCSLFHCHCSLFHCSTVIVHCANTDTRLVFGNVQKVVRTWRVLYILTWKCALRHSAVQFCNIWNRKKVFVTTAVCNFWFLLSPHDSAPTALTSLLLDSPNTRIIEKTQHFATSPTIWGTPAHPHSQGNNNSLLACCS